MIIEAAFIPGVMLGFELAEQEGSHFIVLDLLIVRLVFILKGN